MGLLDRLFRRELKLGAPAAGEAVGLGEVCDSVFSREMLGRGIAIRPSAGRVVAPCDAVIERVMP